MTSAERAGDRQNRSGVRQRRIAESVAEALRDRILAAEGDDALALPTQDQLVKEFNVSYPSIREAIRILETEGLVTVRRGKVGGAQVHRPNESSAAYHLGLALQAGRVPVSDLATGLQMLEPLCAAECARRKDRTREVVPALTASIEASEQLIGEGAAFTHAAREFHELVVAFTPNATVRYVVSTLVALWTAQEETWAEMLASMGEYPSEVDAGAVIRVHRRILKEIAAGRPDEAERVARAHLAATQSFLVERFDGTVNATSSRARSVIAASPHWRV